MNPPPDPLQVRELFHDVVDLRPEARRQYLDAHCSDPQLRQRVERLVAADANATVDQPTPAEVSLPEAEAPPNLPGFETLDQIDAGGMGVVWRVRDPEFQRTLAVKVLKAALCDHPSALRRFLAEARITGQLTHPSIVPVHAMGRLPDGRPYYTMKLVEGKTFDQLLRDRPDPAARRMGLIQVFAQVCQAAAFAHSRGVIHRDLKPANVMVGQHGEVQVMDWGLAKVLDGADSPPADAAPAKETLDEVRDEMGDTHPGSVLGTWAYMPPEQACGLLAEVDRRSDVFGLGAILCELLTGQPPYLGSDPRSVQLQAREAHLDGALARLRGCGADGELIRLAEECLAPNKADRPADASRVVDALVAYQAAVQERLRQAEVERAQAQVKAAEERKRRRLALTLVLALLLLLAGVGGAAFWYQQDREARKLQAEGGVRLNLKEATLLGERAWTLIDNPSSWQTTLDAALAAVQRAQDILEQEPELVGGELAQELEQVQARLRADERDRKLLAVYDQVRLEQSQWDLTRRRFKLAESYPRLQQALADYGLAISSLEPDQALLRLRQRPLAVQKHVLAVLEECRAWVPTEQVGQRQWLEAVLAVEADPWLTQFRQAVTQRAWAQVEQLAAQAEVARSHPAVLVGLARTLPKEARAGKVLLLRRTQQHYPGDFWVNLELGGALYQSVFPTGMSRPAGTEEMPVVNEALAFWRVAVGLRPGNGPAHGNLGNALYAQKDVTGAIACYHKALELDPKDAQAHYNLGNALQTQGDVKGAIASYQTVLALDPKDAQAHTNLGAALQAQGDLKGAIACYQKALALDPKHTTTHYNLGNALQTQGDVKGAIECYQKALALAPKDAQAHTNLGAALQAQGDLKGAIACYQKALALDPKDALAHNGLGTALSAQGDVKGAIACYQKALALDPKYTLAHNNLGVALKAEGDVKEAIACYQKALDLDPKYAPAHYNLGLALAAQKDVKGAIACYQKALDLDPKLALAHNDLGVALKAQGDVEGAIASYKQALDLDPKDARAHYNLGLALQAQGDVDGAIASYTKALALDPKDAKVHNNLGNALKDQGDVKGAIAHYKKALDLDPKLAHAHTNLGVALQAQGDLKGAIVCYKTALDLDPKLAEAHNGLGNALQAQKDWKGAIAHYKKALALDPKYAPAHGALGQALMAQGRFVQAQAATQRALDLLPSGHPLRKLATQQLQHCQRLLDLDARLTAVDKGDQPADAAEQLALAELCQRYKQRYQAAVRFYQDAFAAGVALTTQRAYHAACAAVLAAAGKGEDAAQLQAKQKSRLRQQALAWLRDNLQQYRKQWEDADAKQRAALQKLLRHWQQDTDLSTVRDAEALAKLPETERRPWQQLWTDVEALRKKAQSK
jgi:tetratricopeptide (TPR) repeat protein/tRNA A-37 threonylcarbamoyl transferase component Bud32